MTVLDKKNNIISKRGIPDLARYRLFKIVRRENSPLFDSILRVGSTLRNRELDFDNRMYIHIVLDHDVYSSEDDFDNLRKEIDRKAGKDAGFFGRYFKKVIGDSKKFTRWAKRTKVVITDNKCLLKVYDQFIGYALRNMSHLWPPLGSEGWISSEIQERLAAYIDPKEDFEKFQKILSLLTASEEYSTINLKKQAMLELASKGKISGKELRKLHEEFSWTTDIGLKFVYQTLDEFKEELGNIKDPQKELDRMQRETEKLKADKENAIARYGFDKELLRLCRYAQMLPHVRFARLESLTEAAYRLKWLFDELRRRLRLDDITLAYYWEIRGLLEGKDVDIDSIDARKKGSGFILIGNEFYDYDLQAALSIKEKIEAKFQPADEIKGQTACLGKVKGIVKVLQSAKEISKLEKGDILVASMTTPDYVPAMEKAAAFVTDEGGLSCHAAIVSREMKKPCIIGTKIATKVLKDGDLVEVDADKGIVRRIR